MITQQTHAAEVRLLTSNAMHGVLHELVPAFERASGYKLSVSYDPAQLMLKRIAAGESGDVVMLSQQAIDTLAGEGKVVSDSRRTLARCGIGVGVKAGAPKPDVSSTESFKHALLAAKSIAHTTFGASGIHFRRIVERLGIADEIEAKAVKNAGGLIGTLVARGEAELAIQQIPELMAVPGVDLVGPLPQELQSISVVTIGVFADAKEPQGAGALIDFLAQPSSARVFRAKGLEPA
jgi:molybdate transport system substrate-binding protein